MWANLGHRNSSRSQCERLARIDFKNTRAGRAAVAAQPHITNRVAPAAGDIGVELVIFERARRRAQRRGRGFGKKTGLHPRVARPPRAAGGHRALGGSGSAGFVKRRQAVKVQ